MDKFTFNHPEIAKIINEKFYAVKFESDGNETVSFAGHTFINPDYKNKKTKKSASPVFQVYEHQYDSDNGFSG
jgi:hypothetical protein